MNQLSFIHPDIGFRGRFSATSPISSQAAMQARFAWRVTSALNRLNAELDPDISERLRFARESALARARQTSAARTEQSTQASHQWTAKRLSATRWMQFASAIPALVLIAGLVFIQSWQNDSQISAAAEVDAALLSDDLPPTAYSDPGFVEFLKSPGE